MNIEELWPRRSFIQTTTLGLCGLLTVTCSSEPLSLGDYGPIRPLPDPHQPSFEVFMHLSSMICGMRVLDQDLGAHYFTLFSQEHQGLTHIGTAYSALCQAWQNQSRLTLSDLLQGQDFWMDGERWFVGHLAFTWYAGVYYFENKPAVTVTRSGALMWHRLEAQRIHPGYTPCLSDQWGEPPVETP